MKKTVLIYLFLLIVTAGVICLIAMRDLDSVRSIPEPKETVEKDEYLIDLNTADASEFERIPGVGYKLANNIVKYREEHGPFQEYGELLNVDGIGHSNIVIIMEYVRIK